MFPCAQARSVPGIEPDGTHLPRRLRRYLHKNGLASALAGADRKHVFKTALLRSVTLAGYVCGATSSGTVSTAGCPGKVRPQPAARKLRPWACQHSRPGDWSVWRSASRVRSAAKTTGRRLGHEFF